MHLKHPILIIKDKISKHFERLNELRSDYRRVRKQYFDFKNKSKEIGREFEINWKERWLITGENTNVTRFSAHYIYHPAWAIRIVKKINPKFHIDISSTLSFCSMLSAFIPVKFYDYRPANIHLSDLESGKADLTSLPFESNSVESISCMHTIEHIGLGRYGDEIDPNGDMKAIKELQRVVRKDGSIIFVVPIGKPKIIWNAHRIYSYDQIVNYFKGFELKDFYLIPDNATEKSPIENAKKEDADKQSYGCGCFWFIKK